MPKATPRADDYTADQFEVLEGLEGVRRRPAMYIGSTDARGLQHCVWEILDNAIDEALAGFCRHIRVTLHQDGSVEVEDDGRGIPVDVEKRTKLPGVRVVFERLHGGAKFGGGAYEVSGGLHGVGAAVVNALSSRLDVVVTRQAKRWGMSWRRGTPGVFGADGTFKPDASLKELGKAPASEHGTTVRYWADEDVFGAHNQVDFDLLIERARQSVYLIEGLEITCVDERGEDPRTVELKAEGGIAGLVNELASDEALCDPVVVRGEGTFDEILPGKGEEGPRKVARHVDVEIAFRWGTGYNTTLRSFVNIIETRGGTHVSGFERAVTRALSEAMTGTRLLKADESINKDDVEEGMTAVIVVRLPEPQFEGQTKDALATNEVTGIVANAVATQMAVFINGSKTKAQARRVLEKVSKAAKARLAARMQRDVMRRKNALESSTLPAKLADCRNEDVTRNEILIVEGDSAMGSAKQARDSDFQALLPIRGKILNTMRATERQMLDNAECAAIITAMGAGSGKGFNLDNVRYGKFITLTDADVDGNHIRTLLVTLVWRYMRPLLEAGRVYAAVPPLFRITLKHTGEHIYTYTDEEHARALAQLESSGKEIRGIQRYKGLGEMDADQLAETTMQPGQRKLRRLTVADAMEAEACFAKLMGDEVEPRRNFIVERGGLLDPSRLDI